MESGGVNLLKQVGRNSSIHWLLTERKQQFACLIFSDRVLVMYLLSKCAQREREGGKRDIYFFLSLLNKSLRVCANYFYSSNFSSSKISLRFN